MNEIEFCLKRRRCEVERVSMQVLTVTIVVVHFAEH